MYKYTLFLVGVFACISSQVKGNELSVEFSGFATLSMSYSDDPHLGFNTNYLNASESGFSLSRDSILGAQANIDIDHNWDAIVQTVYQDRSSKSLENFLELAFIRYRPKRNWIVRVGRMNSDLYLLSEYNYVGYAYLWARPPHAYYSFASTVNHYDGVDVEYNNQINNGFLRIKFAVGQTSPKLIAGGEEFSFSFDNLYILSALYLKDEWAVKATTSRSNISDFKSGPFTHLINGLNKTALTNTWPQAAQFAYGFEHEHHSVNYSALGLAYDNDNWLIQTELGTARSDWLIVPSNISSYLSVGYRVNDITYFGSVSVTQDKKKTPSIVIPESLMNLPDEIKAPISSVIARTDYTVRRTRVEQKSFNVGVKWYYSNKLVFKAQADRFIVAPSGAGLWDLNLSGGVDVGHNINLVSFSMSMVF